LQHFRVYLNVTAQFNRIFFKEFGQAMLLPLADEPAQSRSAKQPIEAGLEMLRGLPLEA